MLALARIATLTLMLTSVFEHAASAAGPNCAAILQYGVFDSEHILDVHARTRLVKAWFCDSQNDVDLGNPSISTSSLCSSSFEEILANDTHVASVQKASEIIVSAWRDCIMRRDFEGLVHYFTTTDDPRRFQYTIVFDTAGEPDKTRIKEFNLLPSSVRCGKTLGRPRIPRYIGDAGYTLDCVRSAGDTVTATVSATSGHAKPIHLPALVHSYRLVVSDIDNFGECTIGPPGLTPQPIIGTVNHGAVWLNPYLRSGEKSELTCRIKDYTADNDPGACWSGRFVVLREGKEEVLHWFKRCCIPGQCKGGEQPIWRAIIDLSGDNPVIESTAAGPS